MSIIRKKRWVMSLAGGLLSVLMILVAWKLVLTTSFAGDTGEEGENGISREQSESIVDENADETDKDEENMSSTLDEERLELLQKLQEQKYPFLNLPADEGLTVCVWWEVSHTVNRNEDGEYVGETESRKIKCALTYEILDPSRRMEYTDIRFGGLGLYGISPEEMKLVLSTYDVSRDKIVVIPWINYCSSICLNYPTEDDLEQVRSILFEEKQ